MFGKKDVGQLAVIVLSLIPLLFWAAMQPLSTRFGTFGNTMTSLGQALGLIGLAFFALTFLLNTRARFLEGFFGGLDRMYIAHHTFGTIALVLLLFHPLALALKYAAISLRSAALFLIPGADLPTLFGEASLLLMEILLIITFYIKLKYQKWRFSHQLLGLAFIAGCLHLLLIPSDVSRSLPLRIYMLSLSFIGLSSFAYRTLLEKKLVARYAYIVDSVKKIRNNVVEITLNPEEERMDYLPGQFVFIGFEKGGVSREIHPFTISSSPKEKSLRITVKALGDYTISLPELKIGTIARIEGPFGRFSYKHYPDKEQLWLAGGIGITPFLSMAREMPSGKAIDLFYSVVSPEEAVFLEELEGISKKLKSFKVHQFISSKQGYLTAKYIQDSVPSLKKREIFICGPKPMRESLISQLLRLGIKKTSIHSEEFAL
jgi:predicted ferric reductase